MANLASIKGKWFDANPEHINKAWRPKKGISLVNEQLAQEWYDPAKKSDIEINYMSLLQLWEQRLKLLVNDQEQPMLVRILAKNMLWTKWFDIIEKMLDRGIGKPAQKIDWEQKVDVSVTDERIKEMTAEELSAYLQSKMK